MKKNILKLIFCIVIIVSCNSPNEQKQETAKAEKYEQTNEVVRLQDVNWEQLNPARGDSSPRAGTLWGDRKGKVATGFLVKFVKGFSSPPHIHNVSYRGLVISGLIHNDDPKAANMWMSTGSYWTQPAGEVHITSANDDENMAYIEIESGPYLVMPTEKAFDNGERPVNIVPKNLVWMDASSINWLSKGKGNNKGEEPRVAFLWGDIDSNKDGGTLVMFPKDYSGTIVNKRSLFRGVLIKGQLEYKSNEGSKPIVLDKGSYFTSKGYSAHSIRCQGDTNCTVYIRTQGDLLIFSS